ncbi:MAG TPA: maleylpyruvate isomerase family mycothiol-dependent enzyme, partial [Propionibacteriaceae bacterium]|nr:maleylpyruvate isomerase family mycothiol-dependent enzyme [Propionibacteriaceae bacterium]
MTTNPHALSEFKDALCEALAHAAVDFAALLARVTDPSPRAIGTWTIGETANHVSGSARNLVAIASGRARPHSLGDVDEANARDLAADTERDPGRLVPRFTRGEAELVDWLRAAPGDPQIELFEDVQVPSSTMAAMELGEILVHGRDIARAARLPWRVDPAQSALVLQGYVPLLPSMLDSERAASSHLTIDLRVRGVSPIVIRVRDGVLDVEEPGAQRVDCHVLVDPDVYLLLNWNRISPVPALLTGRMVIWGRAPWTILRFG